jgi:hypothetical protein
MGGKSEPVAGDQAAHGRDETGKKSLSHCGTTGAKSQAILEAVTAYREKEIHTFPLNRDKFPVVKEWNDRDFTPEQHRVDGFHGLGTCPGRWPINIMVFDIDGPQGRESWAQCLKQYGPLPDTWTVTTGRVEGGEHLYYKVPDGLYVKSTASKIGEKIDIRGTRGQAVLPPTVHRSGKVYQWHYAGKPCEIPDPAEIPLLPEPWTQALIDTDNAYFPGQRTPAPPPRPFTGNLGEYAWKALEAETRLVAQAPDGTRNDTLNRAAFSLGQLVAGGELDTGTVESELLAAALSAGLPEGKSRATIKSGMKGGAGSPRRAPEPTYTGGKPADDFRQTTGGTGNHDKPDPWETITPLDAIEVDKLDPATLPGVIGEYAGAVARETETPLELTAGILFVVIAACVQGRVKIQVKPGYSEPLAFWTVTPMDPATRKSQILKRATAPLTEWERRKRAEYEPLIKARRIERENIQARIKALRTKYGKAKPDEIQGIADEIKDLENSLEPELVSPQIWAQDTTPEHAGQIMARNDERLTILAAEGGILDTLGGRYSAGVANLDLFLQGYSGDSVKVGRTSRDDIFLNNPTLSLGLMPQPPVIRGLAAKSEFKGRGFIGRPMYHMPETNLGTRTLDSEPIPEHIKAEYERTIERLLEITPIENTDGTTTPHTLNLSGEAFREWKAFYMVIEKDLADGGRFEHCRDWAGKTPGRAARLAGLLHCAMNPVEPWRFPVTLETMEQALDITMVSCTHALAVFSLMGADPNIEGAGRILKWITRHRHQTFTKRQAFQDLKGTFNRAAMLDEPLAVLMERNYIRPIIETEKKPGRKSEAYEVNPAIHQGGEHGLA